MGISMLDLSKKSGVDAFIRFNSKIFPTRKDVKARFFWQYVDNKALSDKKHPYVLLYKEGDNLVGQSLLNPCEWRFNGKEHKDYFGCDYFVLHDFRGAGGAALAMKTIKDKRDYFAIGVSEVAQKIWKHLGVAIVGKVQLFIWFCSPWVPMRLIINTILGRGEKKGMSKFPDVISSGGTKFKLQKRAGNWRDKPWKDTLQFSRSNDMLKWRFFDSPFDYGFYSSTGKTPMYFVVRRFFSKGVMMLLLVDYRIPDRDTSSWKSVLDATKALAMKMGCGGVIAGSSHSFFDNGLRNSKFRSLKSGSVIMTNTKKVNLSGSLKNRDSIYATMADSDPDMNFEDPMGMAIGIVKRKVGGIFR